jgi:hypothetical protein
MLGKRPQPRDLLRIVAIPYVLFFYNFAIVFKLLCLTPLISLGVGEQYKFHDSKNIDRKTVKLYCLIIASGWLPFIR